jgi:uncharacterized membrane protein YfcA
MTAAFALAAGLVTGALSSWGIGGGTLLILYMTALAGVPQRAAQGTNLTYFIPASLTALYFHAKNRLIDLKAAIPAIVAGVPAALLTSYLASLIDTAVLRRVFGGFLILVGLFEIFAKRDA